MALTSRAFQRFDHVVALGVLSALLLAVVGMGEARAAITTTFGSESVTTEGLVHPTGTQSFCDFVVEASAEGDALLFFGDVVFDPDDLVVSIATTSAAVDEAAIAYQETGFIGLYATLCDRSTGIDPATYAPPFSSARFTVTEAGRTVCEGVLDFPAWALNSDPGTQYELWTVDAQSQWTLQTFSDQNARSAAFEAFMTDFAADFTGESSFRSWDLRVIDCTTAPALVAPVSMLALGCEPAVVSPGALVTCSVTGGDPGIEILWRASASPAFAGAGVRLDADGRGSFSFRVPETVTSGSVLVELVEWDRTATVVVSGSLVPTRVPAGEGMPSGRVALLGLVLLGAAGLLGRRTVLEG